MVVQEPSNLIKLCLKEFGAIVKPVFSHVYGHGYQHSSLLVGILIELQQPEVTTGSKAKHPAMSQGIAQFYDTLGFESTRWRSLSGLYCFRVPMRLLRSVSGLTSTR